MKKIILLLALCMSLFAGVSVGDKAKDFNLKTLDASQNYTLNSFKGDVLLLNVWASWCGGCKEEMPEFYKLQKRYKTGFKIVTVSIDKDSSDAKNFLSAVEQKVGIKTPFITLANGTKSVAKEYRCVAMPSSYLIDKKGVVRDVIVGSLNANDIKELEVTIHKLMVE